jgi:hypothetical protein
MANIRSTDIAYRVVTPDDEAFLLELRKATMDEHMKEARMAVDGLLA